MSKIAFASVALIALVPLFTQACGGTNDVTIGEDGTSRSDAAATTSPTQTSPTGSTTTPPEPQDASPPPVPQDAAPDAPVCPTYYRDEDADGFGGATKQVTCTPPGAGWVDKAGDCNDTNKDVFPGQTLFFGLPIGGGGAGTTASFDYDCSTKEEAGPSLPKAGTCTVAVGGCSGAGYLPAEPARPVSANIDPYCGSARYRFCRFVGGQCVPADGQTDKAYDCH